ncbi:MAG: flavodoxin family protein [Candidatus Bathyarchaeota archaeon]|nr:flavodoxin family protein [Candidatus Bathyarchaeota archaeon]
MKAIVLHGSPRKNMNSDTLTMRFLEGLNEKGSHEVKHFYPNEMDIKPCQGCLGCRTPPDHNCVIEDDMQHIYSAYMDADIIVWASPMYWGYITAQLKVVQDRMEALAWKGFYDKTFVVILTYRHHVESTVGMFKRIAPFFRIKLHFVTCKTYDEETGKDLPISSCVDELEEAYVLGQTLGAE